MLTSQGGVFLIFPVRDVNFRMTVINKMAAIFYHFKLLTTLVTILKMAAM